MHVEGREYFELTDGQLDNIVGEVLPSSPSAGLRLVQGSLNQQGLVVQRARILSSLRRVDPVTSSLRNARQIIRRRYNSNMIFVLPLDFDLRFLDLNCNIFNFD